MTLAETNPPQVGRVSSPAIDKAAQVLQLVAEAGEGVTFGELAARVTIARSSLHDVCSSLVRTGLLEKDADGRYSIGMKVVELSRRRLASLNIVQAFHSVVGTVDLSETVVLAVPGGVDVIYVSFVQSTRPLAVRYEIGMRLPAAFTATGKAMLATIDPAEVTTLFPDQIANVNAGRPGKSRAALLDELDTTRGRGYSIDNEETAAGMVCLGAPIFAEHSVRAVGAIALSLVKGAADWPMPAQSDFIVTLARDISLRMGGSTAWYQSAAVARSNVG